FPDPTHDRQDDPAALGRNPGRLEYLPSFLPGGSPGWIPLCSRTHSSAAASGPMPLALRNLGNPLLDVAMVAFSSAVDAPGFAFSFHGSSLLAPESARPSPADFLAAVIARDLCWSSFLRRVGD